MLSKQLSVFICPFGCRVRPDSLGERDPSTSPLLCMQGHLVWPLPVNKLVFSPGQFQKFHPFLCVWNQACHQKWRGFWLFCFVLHSTQVGCMDKNQRKRGFSKKDTFIFGKAWDNNSPMRSVLTEESIRAVKNKCLVMNGPWRQICALCFQLLVIICQPALQSEWLGGRTEFCKTLCKCASEHTVTARLTNSDF